MTTPENDLHKHNPTPETTEEIRIFEEQYPLSPEARDRIWGKIKEGIYNAESAKPRSMFKKLADKVRRK